MHLYTIASLNGLLSIVCVCVLRMNLNTNFIYWYSYIPTAFLSVRMPLPDTVLLPLTTLNEHACRDSCVHGTFRPKTLIFSYCKASRSRATPPCMYSQRGKNKCSSSSPALVFCPTRECSRTDGIRSAQINCKFYRTSREIRAVLRRHQSTSECTDKIRPALFSLHSKMKPEIYI